MDPVKNRGYDGREVAIQVVPSIGRTPYLEAYERQKRAVEARIRGEIDDQILLFEHDPVFTVGRARGASQNLVAPGDWPVVEVERGGDVTWHGPGQLVAYPIVALTGERRDLRRFLTALEDAVIALLADLGLEGHRDARNTGVWLSGGEGAARKVCAIGIACRRWVTWHGLALNVDPDLAAYERIRPCGFDPSTVTKLSEHLAPCPSIDGLAGPLGAQLERTLGR